MARTIKARSMAYSDKNISHTINVQQTEIEQVKDHISLIATEEELEELMNGDQTMHSKLGQLSVKAGIIDLLVETDGHQGLLSVTPELMNLISDEIDIKSEKIKLEGVVTANNYFKINNDGSAETIRGNIGEWSIDETGIYRKPDKYSDLSISSAYNCIHFRTNDANGAGHGAYYSSSEMSVTKYLGTLGGGASYETKMDGVDVYSPNYTLETLGVYAKPYVLYNVNQQSVRTSGSTSAQAITMNDGYGNYKRLKLYFINNSGLIGTTEVYTDGGAPNTVLSLTSYYGWTQSCKFYCDESTYNAYVDVGFQGMIGTTTNNSIDKRYISVYRIEGFKE